MGKPLAVCLIWTVFLVENEGTVDNEIVELHITGLAGNLDRLFDDAIKLTVLDGDISYVLYLVATNDEHTIVALLAGYVFHIHLRYAWFKTAIANLLWLVIEVDLYDSFLTLPHSDVAHVDVLDDTTAAVVGLDAQDAVEVRRVHFAIFGIYILASARDFTSDNHTAMSIFHLTVADDDVFGRLVPETTIIVASALDGNTVITGMEDTVLDEHILASLWVASVTIRSFIPDGHTIYGDVLGEQRMDNPERRVEHLDTLDEDALRTYEVDELWAQPLSLTKFSFVERHTVFSLFQQFGT